jgi:hypothetical protein
MCHPLVVWCAYHDLGPVSKPAAGEGQSPRTRPRANHTRLELPGHLTGQFDCSDQIAQLLACSDRAELLHCEVRLDQLGTAAPNRKNAASRICAAQSSLDEGFIEGTLHRKLTMLGQQSRDLPHLVEVSMSALLSLVRVAR